MSTQNISPDLKSDYKSFVDGLNIFAKYAHDQLLYAEHDVIYAGPSPDVVSAEDLVELDALGWYPDDNDCGFMTYV